MYLEPVTEETFQEWKNHPVTRRFMKMLYEDREQMKEGLVYDAYDNPDNVQGRCQVIATLLNVERGDLYELQRDKPSGEPDSDSAP